VSDSTIIQDEKLFGAVTHVHINNPCHGYESFIENMLDVAEKIHGDVALSRGDGETF